MTKRLGWLLFTSAMALGAAPALRADDAPVPSARFDAERLREHLERLRDHKRSAPSAAPSGSSTPGSAPSSSSEAEPLGSPDRTLRRAEELARKWAALASARIERREKHRENLVRQLGVHLSEPAVAAELKLHATRLAELNRLEFLAQNARQGAAREQLLARVQRLVVRESERHRRHLAKLTAAPPPGSAAAGPAPPPSSGSPP
ncbi:MAG TPA: hypothetical protein VEQ59_04170 [Polyangiaceae bacterium]|nr:hypothetical protein [Polyangiaceae bacterium]